MEMNSVTRDCAIVRNRHPGTAHLIATLERKVSTRLTALNWVHSFRNASHSRCLSRLSSPTSMRSLRINADNQHQLKTQLCQLDSPLIQQEAFIAQAHRTFTTIMHANIIHRIASLQQADAPSVLLLRGLPIDDDLPNTPTHFDFPIDKKTFVSEGVLLGIGAVLGESFGFSREKNGALIHMVCPQPGKEQSQSTVGSKADLKFHTENAYLDFRPDFIILSCLRADPDQQAQTLFIDGKKLFAALSTQQRDWLKQPLYQAKVGESFETSNKIWSRARPILSGSAQNPTLLIYEIAMRVDPALPMAIQQRAHQALKALCIHLKPDSPLIESHRLAPGDVLIINNRTAIHGRTAFVAQTAQEQSGKNRWLERVYVTDTKKLQAQKTLPHHPRIVDIDVDTDCTRPRSAADQSLSLLKTKQS